MPKLTGRQTITGFLASIMPAVKGIQVKQHIVEEIMWRLSSIWKR